MSESRPRILAFKSPSCSPCRALAPILEALADRYAGQVDLELIDTWEKPEVAAYYHVTSVPTLLGLVGDQVVQQQVGYAGADRVEALFARLAWQSESTIRVENT